MTRSACRASRSAWASSGSRCWSTRSRTCASCSRTTCGCWSSSGHDPGPTPASVSDGGHAVMRVPVAWLRSYCDPGLSAEAIADALTMAGDKLERLHRTGVGDPRAFVIGKVLAADPHPDADRLSVCTVDDGSGEARTIVCGAPNVATGQTVAVARPGALMLDGTELGEAKLRGVRSSGMILAEDEIGEDHRGIMVLPDGPPPGSPLAVHLQIVDEVLELEITPNRPDTMSVYGVARDLHAATAAPLAPDPTDADAEPVGDDS